MVMAYWMVGNLSQETLANCDEGVSLGDVNVADGDLDQDQDGLSQLKNSPWGPLLVKRYR